MKVILNLNYFLEEVFKLDYSFIEDSLKSILNNPYSYTVTEEDIKKFRDIINCEYVDGLVPALLPIAIQELKRKVFCRSNYKLLSEEVLKIIKDSFLEILKTADNKILDISIDRNNVILSEKYAERFNEIHCPNRIKAGTVKKSFDDYKKEYIDINERINDNLCNIDEINKVYNLNKAFILSLDKDIMNAIQSVRLFTYTCKRNKKNENFIQNKIKELSYKVIKKRR